MVRVIVLCFLIQTIGLSQDTILSLTYTQIISSDFEEESPSRKGFMKVFSPAIMDYMESNTNLEKRIYIQEDRLYSQTYLNGKDDIFTIKFQMSGDAYVINELTGEKLKLKHRANHYDSEKLRRKLKRRASGIAVNFGCPFGIFRASEGGVTIELHVSDNIQVKETSGLFREFSYNGHLILEKRIKDKKEGKEIIFKLSAIDTIIGSGIIEHQVSQKQELVLANKHIKRDSIGFDTEVMDVYFKRVGSGEISSLNEYKGNGKYLLIDFWGTWCKPCLASIPELKSFYEKYSDQVDILSMNYKDSNLNQVKEIIKETMMTWDQGIATTKVNNILNPQLYFPGVIMFNDEMKLILRSEAKEGLEKAKQILEQKDGIEQRTKGR